MHLWTRGISKWCLQCRAPFILKYIKNEKSVAYKKIKWICHTDWGKIRMYENINLKGDKKTFLFEMSKNKSLLHTTENFEIYKKIKVCYI